MPGDDSYFRWITADSHLRNFSPFFCHNRDMELRRTQKRRGMGWLLALALLVLAVPSGASWQCLNGTPCPSDCPMLRGIRTSLPQCAADAAVHCSRCHPAGPMISALSSHGQVFCTTPQCVLRVNTKPAATLRQKQAVPLPLLALPPPAPVSVLTVAVATISCPTSLPFYPQRFLRPHFGRAPPVLLG